MGLSDATMQWWDEWKLRILVLCSLCVQFILNFSFWVRIWPKLRRLRVVVWMAHIGGDALAIYALATLFNRQKQQTVDGGSDALELIWVPFLLIHLGGPEMSAYSLEDNELWKRHALTLVSQVTVALYIFCKWWSGQKKLLQAAVLLFVVGILKFGEKPWALKKASFNTMASKSLSTRREGSLPPCWKWCTSDCTDFASAIMKEEDQSNLSIEDYVKQARGLVLSTVVQTESDQKTEGGKKSPQATNYTSMMLVDLSTRYSLRLNYLEYFLKMDDKNGHILLRTWIMNTFNALYTKRASASTCFGCCSGLLLPFLALASLVLFAKSDKNGYNESDITVSYILFSCTILIQFAPFLFMPCNIWGAFNIATWQDMVSQHNLMLFCARKKQPTTLMKRATLECLREYINKLWCTWQEPAALQIEGLIRHYIQDGWKEYISDNDPTTYRRFNNLRGQWTLSRHSQLGQQLGWSLDLPFDEIVLVWHIATDLCFHTSSEGQSGVTIQYAWQISNYMIYLLFICPEMLMPGTRQDLFIIACDDIDRILEEQKDPPSIAQRIRHMKHDELKGGVLQNAHKLAEGLMGHPNEEERWKVIQGVWVEMLCYSASRCRGYLHAKSLGEGGEFLTNVWFLWSLMGMEILGDKIHIQNQPLKEEGIMGAPV